MTDCIISSVFSLKKFALYNYDCIVPIMSIYVYAVCVPACMCICYSPGTSTPTGIPLLGTLILFSRNVSIKY